MQGACGKSLYFILSSSFLKSNDSILEPDLQSQLKRIVVKVSGQGHILFNGALNIYTLACGTPFVLLLLPTNIRVSISLAEVAMLSCAKEKWSVLRLHHS